MTMTQSSSPLEYIKCAIQLETDVATQEQILQDFKALAQSRKPVFTTQPVPEKPAVT